MKTIKLKFVGFWDTFNPKESQFYILASKYFNLELSENPDYIICSCFGEPYEYLKYKQIRIMVCGENYIPDFNFIDYAICRYPITFLDRAFYEPGCIKPFPDSLKITNLETLTKNDLLTKKYFCNFICSHESENNIRGDFYKKLSEYKKVESFGKYLNNTGKIVNRKDGSKKDCQKLSKFSLCFESTKNEGFITEKITEAFLNGTIPIYYGSNTINEIFNKESFVNVSDYKNFDEAIEKIKEIDNDDELYLSMVNAKKLVNPNYFNELIKNEELFIKNIFDQPLECAYRRSRVYTPINIERFIRNKQPAKRKNLKTAIKRFFRIKL